MTIYAMVCGINYVDDPENRLNGCVNDMLDMRALLLKSGVAEKDITTLSDSPEREDIYPSRDNILAELKKIGAKAKPGDTIVVHYSGHGTYSRDMDNDETDKRDEAICPADGSTISDDELYGMLRKLPKDVKAFVLMDCCHSGSMLDLANGLDKNESKRKADNTHGYVVEISGCQDNQTSADALFTDKSKKSKPKEQNLSKRECIQQIKKRGKDPEPRYRGALTSAFMEVVEKRRGLQAIFDICFSGSKSLMRSLRADILKVLKAGNFSQVPNIAYEGATPAKAKATYGEPILHGYRINRYSLRKTSERMDRGGYVATAEVDKHSVKLR